MCALGRGCIFASVVVGQRKISERGFVSGNWPRSDQYTGTRGFGNDSEETQHATAIGTRITRNHRQNLSFGQTVTLTGGFAELC